MSGNKMNDYLIDFIASNADRIISYTNRVYKKADAKIQTTINTAYKKYLDNVSEKYSKAKSFFIRNQPTYLYNYYVSTSIKCESKVFKEPKFTPLISFNKKIIITGSGGCGKSIIMRHLFLDCIKSKKYVPIFVELRELNSNEKSLDELILDNLDNHGFKISQDYIDISFKDGHFCLFFDGLDEVVFNKRDSIVSSIIKISIKYKKCPLFLSSRNDEIFGKFEEFSIFQIEPLTLNNATELVKKLPFDVAIKNKFNQDLNKGLFEKHQSFLSNPLLLSIMLLTYSEHAEIPTKLSSFYNQAYEVLFQRHDAHKGAYVRQKKTSLDMQDFSRVFALFCLQTYEKRAFTVSRTDTISYIEKSLGKLKFNESPEDYLEDLLKAACLLIEDGLDISFSHRSFQEYFVARYISISPPEIQQKLIERYSTGLINDNIINLLIEINSIPVERYLIIPVLQKLFTKFQVRKSITENIALKILKETYSSIGISSRNGVYAILKNNKDNIRYSQIFRLANKITNNYIFKKDNIYISFSQALMDKYGIEDSEEFTIESNSGFIKDVIESEFAFSRVYYQSIYESFIEIKKSNEDSLSEIDELLGL